MEYIQKIRQLIDIKTKRHLVWLVFFSICVSAIEAIGVSVIMPFIGVVTDFDVIQNNQYYRRIFNFLNFQTEVDFAIFFGLTLVVFYIFRGIVNLLYNYSIVYFATSLYAQTTKRLFKVYLAMPYQVFSGKNSSYLVKAIITEASLMSTVIKAVLEMIAEVFVIIFIYVLMLIVSWKITLILTLILVIKITFLVKMVSKKVKKIGVVRAKIQENFYEIINRIFGNFKQVKLIDSDRLENIQRDFSVTVEKYAKINTMYSFLTSFPGVFIEAIGFSLIVMLLVALLYLNQSEISYILPTLSLFVLALYRLLPSISRIVHGYNSLMYHHKSIDIIDEELKTEQENIGDSSIQFNHKIELKNISFSHKKKIILSDISLTIDQGDRIAFVGESGSGKSTLVDIIIGLNRPDEGGINIDNTILDESNLQNWRAQFGYIPQQVYLFDGTVLDNVCFGRKVDQNLLKQVLRQANIFDFLQDKEGVNTLVGEGGIQLSGGQKQRIAIARALYGQPKILVLDEATSALDVETEQVIMQEIYKISENKTLIIIAHRLSTIKNCNKVYKLKNKGVYSFLN